MRITLLGDPIPKTRHRCRCVGKHAVAYDPQVKKEMEDIKVMMLRERGFSPSAELNEIWHAPAIQVLLDFYLPVPKSDSISERNLKYWGLIRNGKKPDWDNLCKFYTDCGNGLLWKDDSQIIIGVGRKVKYSPIPRTQISISTISISNLGDKRMNVFKHYSPQEATELMQSCQNLYDAIHNAAPGFENEKLLEDGLLNEIADEMIDFSLKHADKLKKIAKANAK